MSNKVASFVIFTLGAAVGSFVTWYCVKQKYELIIQDEIQSIRDTFAKRSTQASEQDSDSDIQSKANQAKEKPDIAEYTSRLQKQGYTNYSDASSEKKNEVEKEPMTADKPYVIAPEEFGAIEEYEQISLTYYADRILTDDNDDMMVDVEETIGLEALSSFGEFEDDSVFVRNDRLKCDYEILLDQRRYSDTLKRRPHEVTG